MFCDTYQSLEYSPIDDSTRVTLKEIEGEESSDYINASYLDVRKVTFIHKSNMCFTL